MKLICPVCNGLYYLNHNNCPNCGALLEDNGPVNNFLGSYSPYLDDDIAEDWEDDDYEDRTCVHLLSCPYCGKDIRKTVDLVEL